MSECEAQLFRRVGAVDALVRLKAIIAEEIHAKRYTGVADIRIPKGYGKGALENLDGVPMEWYVSPNPTECDLRDTPRIRDHEANFGCVSQLERVHELIDALYEQAHKRLVAAAQGAAREEGERQWLNGS